MQEFIVCPKFYGFRVWNSDSYPHQNLFATAQVIHQEDCAPGGNSPSRRWRTPQGMLQPQDLDQGAGPRRKLVWGWAGSNPKITKTHKTNRKLNSQVVIYPLQITNLVETKPKVCSAFINESHQIPICFGDVGLPDQVLALNELRSGGSNHLDPHLWGATCDPCPIQTTSIHWGNRLQLANKYLQFQISQLHRSTD